MISALFFPITIFLTGIAIPMKMISLEGLHALLDSPIVRVYLFFLISFPMFHWAHRFRYVVADMGLKQGSLFLSILCYSFASVTTIATLVYLIFN